MRKTILLSLICLSVFSQTPPSKDIKLYPVDEIDFGVFDTKIFQKKFNSVADKEFLNKYFSVWNKKDSLTEEEYDMYFNYNSAIKSSPCIGENLIPLQAKIIKEIQQNIAFSKEEIGQKVYFGLSINTVDIRRFPTKELCFKNIRNAGESYPFDYFQYSSLWLASPVRILKISKDKLWYFIDSQNNKGWVKANDIAIVTEKQKKDFQKKNFVITTKEKVLIKGKFKNYRIHIGTLLPVENSRILIPTKNISNTLVYDYVEKSPDFKKFPLKFNKANVKLILTELHDYKYTWGGINNGRDCSSTLKDFYSCFGLWLPRNSKQQKEIGTIIELNGSNEQKQNTIKDKGIPFLSTLYKKGHIVMYIGNGRILQNVWGIKAYYKNKTLIQLEKQREKYGLFGFDKKGDSIIQTRFPIGRVVVTDIEPSINLDKKYESLKTESFLENFISISNLK